MIRKILAAYGLAKQPEPEPEKGPREGVEGVDYDWVQEDEATTNKTNGRRSVPMWYADAQDKRTGFLTADTFERVRDVMAKHGIHCETSLGILSRMEQNPSDAATKRDGKRIVEDILEGLARRQQKLLNEGGDNFASFLTNLQKAVKLSGDRDPIDLLQKFNSMSHEVRNCFSDEEQAAMTDKKWRAGTVEQAKSYFELREVSGDLRREALDKLGEEYMRREHDHQSWADGVGTAVENGHIGFGRHR